ncbi:MAG: c-type cytochrome [Acidobacteriota bacterium]
MIKSGRRWASIGVIAGLATAVWAGCVGFSVSAHEGHKRKNAPISAKKLKSPITATEENIAAGGTLFAQNCAICHGEDGKSQTDVAKSMKIIPTDLTGMAMHGITDGEIYWVVTNGIRIAKMPAFKTRVSTGDRWQMTLYVKQLMGEHATAAHGDLAQKQNHGAHQPGHDEAVNQRGDKVMGFSHEKTTHHFRLKVDGGAIEVDANDPADAASRDQIRTHLQHIAGKFAAGDFTAPMMIHAQNPPGVSTMKRLKLVIKYDFEETERGGRVRITSVDDAALSAIHEFLRFQISDHRTGDSTEIEKSP